MSHSIPACQLPDTLWSSAPPEHLVAGVGVLGSVMFWMILSILVLSSIMTIGSLLIVRLRVVVTTKLQTLLFAKPSAAQPCNLYAITLGGGIDNYDQRLSDDLQTMLDFGVGQLFGSLTINPSLFQNLLSAGFNFYQVRPRVLCRQFRSRVIGVWQAGVAYLLMIILTVTLIHLT